MEDSIACGLGGGPGEGARGPTPRQPREIRGTRPDDVRQTCSRGQNLCCLFPLRGDGASADFWSRTVSTATAKERTAARAAIQKAHTGRWLGRAYYPVPALSQDCRH